MYTQHSELKGTRADGHMNLSPIEDGATVRLLSQTADHKVTFAGPGDAAPVTLPSHEFFAQYREAYPGEISAFEKANKPAATAKT